MSDTDECAMEADFEGDLFSMEVDVEGSVSKENPVLSSKCSATQTSTDRAVSHCVSFVLACEKSIMLKSSVQEQLVSSMLYSEGQSKTNSCS